MYYFTIIQIDNIFYLLSSISQGLAAIFTLVFAITVFGTQMMRKFTALDKIIDGWTVLLMLLFTLGIIFPLIQLGTDEKVLNKIFISTNLSIAIDLFIACLCILSIIPYTLKINRIIKYEGGIPKLSEELSEAIDSDRKAIVSSKLNELVELGNAAMGECQLNQTTKIVKKLEISGMEIANKRWLDQTVHTINGLQEIQLKSWDKKFMDITGMTISALVTIGLESVEENLDGEPRYLRRCSVDIKKGYYPAIDYELAPYTYGKYPGFGLLEITDFFNGLNFHKALMIGASHAAEEKPKVFKLYDDYRTKEILNELEFIGIERYFSVPQQVMKVLKKIGIKASKSRYSIGIAMSTLNGLKQLAISAINSDLSPGTVSMSYYCIYEICIASIESKYFEKDDEFAEELLAYAVECLENIADIAYKKDENKFKKSYEVSLEFLWILGAYSNKYLPEYAKDMASGLKNSSNRVIRCFFEEENVLEEARRYIESYREFSELIDELKAFENLYNKSDIHPSRS